MASGRKLKIAVIGGGFAGLSAATKLAFNGHDVTILEKNSNLGGKASQFWLESEHGRFRFDSGPSLGTMYNVFEEFFDSIGEDIENYLNITFLEVSSKNYFPDGSIITAYVDPERFSKEISNKTNTSLESAQSFFRHTQSLYQTGTFFLEHEPNLSLLLIGRFWGESLKMVLVNPLKSMERDLKRFFRDTNTIKIFLRSATFTGSNPFVSPLLLNSIHHVQHSPGNVFFPKGGIYQISDALQTVAQKKGVIIQTGTEVTRIIPPEITQKRWIVETESLEQVNIENFDAVISNVDYYTTQKLLPSQFRKKIPPAQAFSTSGVVFYWGISSTFPQLDLHNVFFPEDYQMEFKAIFSGNIDYTPTIYIHVSCKLNDIDAPKGCENWFVMINTPPNPDIVNEETIQMLKKKIITLLNTYLSTNLEKLILTESISTPKTIENITGSFKGSLYGLNMNTIPRILSRPQIRSSHRGLYYAGGSVHPGGGMPLAILSGKKAAQHLLHDNEYGRITT